MEKNKENVGEITPLENEVTPLEKSYSAQETATMLGLHINTIMKRLRDGSLRHYRTKGKTGRYRIPYSAILEMTNSQINEDSNNESNDK